MRILVLSNYFPPDFRGGFEISASLICNSLAHDGHQVTVLTQENPAAPGDENPNLRIHRVLKIRYKNEDAEQSHPKLRGWIAVNATFRNGAINIPILREHLKTNSYDLVLCFNLESVGASLASEAQRHGLPVLWSIGDYWIFERLQVGTQGRLARLNRFFWSKRQVQDELGAPWQHVIFNCENVHAKFTEAGVEPEHTYIVNRSCPPPEQVLPYDWEHRERVFLVASQIREHKGIHIVLEAAQILAKDESLPQDWKVIILGAGDQNYLERLKAMTQDSGLSDRVQFLGRVPQSEVAQHMGRCMAFIHSALWDEPFGRVTMEAMAYAAPLISADSGAVYEIATEKCALIYDRFDPAALAEKMKLILLDSELAKSYIAAGRERYEANFRPEIEAARMREVIEKVIASNR